MTLSAQFHASAALLPGQEPLICIELSGVDGLLVRSGRLEGDKMSSPYRELK